MTKLTYVSALESVLTSENLTDEVREKLTVLRDQLVKRNTADHKPTKAQQVNEGVKAQVLAALATVGKAVTVTELQEADEALGALSNQKVSALLRQLVEAGKVVKSTEKRKTYFALAE